MSRAAIWKIENLENLNKLKSYLTYNFLYWINQFTNTPENIVKELKIFSNVETD